MPTVRTSQNLTILGSGGLLAALGTAIGQYFQGGLAAINWNALIPVVIASLIAIMAKGQASTGGTVNAAGQPVVDPAPPVAPKGFVTLIVLIALAWVILFAGTARAQTPDAPPPATRAPAPVSSPLSVDLTPDLSLYLNVSILAFSYDLSHKAYLGQGQIGGLYALTSKRLYSAGIAVGGAITFDSQSKPLGEVNVGVVTPKLVISPTLALRGAILYARRFGPDSASLLRLAPTLEF
jgi:hypothetical protein